MQSHQKNFACAPSQGAHFLDVAIGANRTPLYNLSSLHKLHTQFYHKVRYFYVYCEGFQKREIDDFQNEVYM